MASLSNISNFNKYELVYSTNPDIEKKLKKLKRKIRKIKKRVNS
jgi:uncharacterized protein YfcZ (UPF0381/DUF406 family)